MLSTILSALPYLLKTAPSIKAGYEGINLKQQKQALDQMNQLAGQQKQLAAAQSDMNNPLFQNIYQQERGAGQQDLAETIAELSRQNRKLTSMGRSQLLDRERGGESIFRNLVMGQQDVGNQARQNTFGRLSSVQQALGNAGNAYGSIFSGQKNIAGQELQNKGYSIGASATLGDTLQKLFGLGQSGSQSQMRNGETINWNQPSTPNNWVSYR